MIALAGIGLAAVIALTGCSSSKHAAAAGSTAPPPSTTSAATPPPSTTAAATTTAAASSAPPSSVAHSTAHPTTPLCTSDIRVIPGALQGAPGHPALVLVFNNVSTTKTCEIIGYPGVDLVTATGATVAHLTRTLRGTEGGEPAGVTAPQPVILAPGHSASALAEATVPQGGAQNCGSYALLITVPNQFVSVGGGTAMLPRCDAQIHPVVPGTSGGLG